MKEKELYNKLRILKVLIAISLLNLILFFIYFLIQGAFWYSLAWNLFLAVIPWFVSSFIVLKNLKSKVWLYMLIFIWAIFFPNAPYLFTDITGLQRTDIIWFEFMYRLHFAWPGLLFGYLSLADIIVIFEEKLKPVVLNCAVAIYLFLTGFGIYLGKFLRWNSWDILTHPIKKATVLIKIFSDPKLYYDFFINAFLFGVLLNTIYFSIVFIRNSK